jgi:hypothetical protein
MAHFALATVGEQPPVKKATEPGRAAARESQAEVILQ